MIAYILQIRSCNAKCPILYRIHMPIIVPPGKCGKMGAISIANMEVAWAAKQDARPSKEHHLSTATFDERRAHHADLA